MSTTEARRDVIAQLNRLDELIQPVVSPHAGLMGHNRTPEPMEVENPCAHKEWLDLNQAVQSIQTLVDSIGSAVQAISRWIDVLPMPS